VALNQGTYLYTVIFLLNFRDYVLGFFGTTTQDDLAYKWLNILVNLALTSALSRTYNKIHSYIFRV